MTIKKMDTALADYLGTCWYLDKQAFSTNYFMVSCLVRMYKRYGEKFIDEFHRGRT